jgi:hypothetical protein
VRPVLASHGSRRRCWNVLLPNHTRACVISAPRNTRTARSIGINCHTITDYPRQSDIRYPHIYGIARGADDHGAPVGRCWMCHGSENNMATGVPGRSDWHIAPLTMAWESAPGIAMTGPELCAMLKDRLRNGNRSLAELLTHVETEHLVLWAWDPGARWNGEARQRPPLSHEQFVNSFKAWVDAGASCPSQYSPMSWVGLSSKQTTGCFGSDASA